MNLNHQIYPDLPPEERVIMLEKLALRKQKTTYTRNLTPEELLDEKDVYSREQMHIEALEDEFDEMKKGFKAQIDALIDLAKKRLHIIKHGSKEYFDLVWEVPDYVEKMILGYDRTGELVSHRPMKPEERQTRLQLPDAGVEEPKADQVNGTPSGPTGAINTSAEHFEDAEVIDPDEEPQDPKPEKPEVPGNPRGHKGNGRKGGKKNQPPEPPTE